MESIAAVNGLEVRGQRFTRAASGQGIELVDTYFEDCHFGEVDLAELSLRGCELQGCTFEDCNLSLMRVPDTTFAETTFVRCRMIGVDWTAARWSTLALDGLIGFEGCDLESSTFMDLDLPGLRLVESRLHLVDLSGAHLPRADFTRSDLAGAVFNRTDLRESDLSTATGYAIDPGRNAVAGARFSLPEAASLLDPLGIVLVEPDLDPGR